MQFSVIVIQCVEVIMTIYTSFDLDSHEHYLLSHPYFLNITIGSSFKVDCCRAAAIKIFIECVNITMLITKNKTTYKQVKSTNYEAKIKTKRQGSNNRSTK